MKFVVMGLLASLAVLSMGGCCTSGYNAPPYQAAIIGCVPAFVPSR